MRGPGLASMIAILMMASCARQVASPPYIETNVAQGDVSFITYSYDVIRFDLDESRLAVAQAADPEVKEVATSLIEIAGEFRGMIAPAADRAGIEPPNELNNDLERRLDAIRPLSGMAFDRAYVADQIASHQDAFAHVTQMIGATVDPDLNRLLRRSVVQLQASLERLRALQRRLG